MPTKIEWTDETFNPWTGCEKVSPACAHCYAETQAHRFDDGLWGAGHAVKFKSDAYWRRPLIWARTLPATLGRRPRVFCASMADVFEERDELDEHRLRLFELIAATPELDWLLLTKRPEFARDYLYRVDTELEVGGTFVTRGDPDHFGWGCPANVWVGVSIENARFTWRADVLREIPAAVRFISAEPLLGSLFERSGHEKVGRGVEPGQPADAHPLRSKRPLDLTAIDWLIIGGESGPGSRPFHLEHARELVSACQESATATFVKQLGKRPHIAGIEASVVHSKGGDPDEWPDDLRIREFPQAGVAA